MNGNVVNMFLALALIEEPSVIMSDAMHTEKIQGLLVRSKSRQSIRLDIVNILTV